MNLFYAPDTQQGLAAFPPEEARHCVQVLRHRAGDTVHWVDGKGTLYSGPIVEAYKQRCLVQVEQRREEFGRRPFRLHLAVAPTKQIDRTEWLLEKATEIGVDEITFLLCARSERRRLRLDRLEKILVAAMKQSLKAYLPLLHDLTPFSTFIQQYQNPEQRYIAYVDNSQPLPLKTLCRSGGEVGILIGPEGDFDPDEIALALEHGFQSVSLGPSRLRTETAGMVACAIANLANQ